MPLYRKIPKRGFKNPNREEVQPLNLKRLADLPEEELTPQVLRRHRLVRGRSVRYKVLGTGDLSRALVIWAHAFSRTARAKIESAGGRCEVIA